MGTHALTAEDYQAGVAAERAANRSLGVNYFFPWRTPELLDQEEFLAWSVQEWELVAPGHPDRESAAAALELARWQLDEARRELRRRRNLHEDAGKRPGIRLDQRRHVDFAELKRRVRLEEVVRTHGNAPLVSTGRDRYVTRCMLPGHDDNSPSFVVYVDQQSFHCYGCGRGGDAIDWAKHWAQQPNAAYAAELLAGLAGIDLPKTQQAPADERPGYLGKDGRMVPLTRLAQPRRRAS